MVAGVGPSLPQLGDDPPGVPLVGRRGYRGDEARSAVAGLGDDRLERDAKAGVGQRRSPGLAENPAVELSIAIDHHRLADRIEQDPTSGPEELAIAAQLRKDATSLRWRTGWPAR